MIITFLWATIRINRKDHVARGLCTGTHSWTAGQYLRSYLQGKRSIVPNQPIYRQPFSVLLGTADCGFNLLCHYLWKCRSPEAATWSYLQPKRWALQSKQSEVIKMVFVVIMIITVALVDATLYLPSFASSNLPAISFISSEAFGIPPGALWLRASNSCYRVLASMSAML